MENTAETPVRVNRMLALGTLSLVFIFPSSSELAAAYALAVTATMVITTLLTYFVAVHNWGWPRSRVLLLTLLLLLIDLSFFSSNLLKFLDGGWIPVLLGLVIFVCMITWRRGRSVLSQRLKEKALPIRDLQQDLKQKSIGRVPGTAVFMTSVPDISPPSLVHNLRHNHIVHEHTILLTVQTETVPYVDRKDRYEVRELEPGIYSMLMRFGFMQLPDVPNTLAVGLRTHCVSPSDEITYFLGRETIIPSNKPGMVGWQARLFSFMSTNSQKATDFFHLPAQQVFEIGIVIEL